MEKINCCVIACVLALANILQLLLFFNYSLKLKSKEVILEKRTEELEKKNGAEQRQINELKEEIRKLKERHD
jgi:uncharacterized protein YlxW (UPF0749 family)